MKRSIHPGAEGNRVAKAKMLLHENRYGRFIGGKHLGVKFGPLMCIAVRQAKHELGYPEARTHSSVFGGVLRSYLDGSAKLPLKYRYRRAKRATAKMLRSRTAQALAIALRHVGYIEGADNANKFGEWYGMNHVAWCAEFVSYCFEHAGLRFHYAYVPYALADATAGRNGLRYHAKPKRGLAVCFDWEGNGVPDHIGIVVSVNRDGSVETAEGNTSPADFSNGGMVMRRTRYPSQIAGYIEVREKLAA